MGQSAVEESSEKAPPVWRRFPTGEARIRANRWLDRRRAVLFCGWYLLILIPCLWVIQQTAEVGTALGFLLLILGYVAGVMLSLLAAASVGGRRALINHATALEGGKLLTRYGNRVGEIDLHVGGTEVRAPRWRYGRAWVLTIDVQRRTGVAVLLLTDPATGRPRPWEELRELNEALAASPAQADKVTAQEIYKLAGEVSAADGDLEPDSLPATVWSTFKSLGRMVPLAFVVLTIFYFGGLTDLHRQAAHAGVAASCAVYVLMGTAVALTTLWVPYFGYRLWSFLSALLRAWSSDSLAAA